MRYFVTICLIVFMFSCNNVNKPPKPENLISHEKMVAILVDLTIYNSAKGTNKTVIDNKSVTIENYIYKRHNVDSIQFKESNEYYTYDVETYTRIYEKVEDSLTKLKEKYTEERDSMIEEKKHKQDSLKSEKRRRMNPKKFNDSITPKKPKVKISPEVF